MFSDAITKAYADSKGVKISTYTGNGKYGGDSTPYTTTISIEEGTKFVIIYSPHQSIVLYQIGSGGTGLLCIKGSTSSNAFLNEINFTEVQNELQVIAYASALYQLNVKNSIYTVVMFF